MARRQFLSRLAALPFFAIAASALPPATGKTLNIMEKSAWGSDDPTRASFPFLHALALAEAGHNVQIFLLGEAVSLMRKSIVDAIVPVGWPPLAATMEKIIARKIQVYA
jgi:predicted peroxiredoxin